MDFLRLKKAYEWEQLTSTNVLVYSEGEIICAYLKQDEDDGIITWYSSCSEGWELKNVTHWMELPEAPRLK